MDVDPQELALQHGEKAVLGAFAIWMLVVLVGFGSDPEVMTSINSMQGKLDSVGSYMDTATPEEKVAPTWENDLKRAIDPSQVGQTPAWPSWIMHRRPGFTWHVKPIGGVDIVPVHTPATDVRADSGERGVIRVSWSTSRQNIYVEVRYELWRGTDPDDPDTWEKISEWDWGRRAEDYEDRGSAESPLRGGLTYSYKVVTYARIDGRNRAIQRANERLERLGQPPIALTSAQTQMESAITDDCSAGTKRDVFIVPITIVDVTFQDQVNDPDAIESAYLRVYKWDPAGNQFRESAFNVIAGQPIPPEGQAEVNLPRGQGKFDFTTGAILESVEPGSRPHPTLKDAEGNPLPQEVQEITVRWTNETETPDDDERSTFTDKDPDPRAE
jgi:hypothetical protein